MKHLNYRRLAVAAAAAAVAVGVTALPAGATSGTATITAGSLAFVSSPSTVAFSATLNGVDQSVTSPQSFDVSDATGSGTGWNITATSTTFTTTAPVHTLSTAATTVTGAPTDTCDASTTCVLATNGVAYPYTLPAAGAAPTATKLINAAVNTGMGNQTEVATFHLSVPASTFAGTYTSTWTYSLVSGP